MTSSKYKRRAADATALILVIGAVMYFGHRALLGESGQYARWDVEREIRALSTERAQLADERARLENLTKRLGTDYLDLDLLDERARTMLGHMREDEVVIR
ncbi:MAG: septum formation initiator family protein [Pseudomonadota bacterium]